MASLLYLVVYCLKSCHIRCVTHACWCISIGSADELGQRNVSCFTLLSSLRWSSDGQWTPAVNFVAEYNTGCRIHYNRHINLQNLPMQRVLHGRWSLSGILLDLSINMVLESHVEIFREPMSCLSFIQHTASVLLLQCNLITVLCSKLVSQTYCVTRSTKGPFYFFPYFFHLKVKIFAR